MGDRSAQQHNSIGAQYLSRQSISPNATFDVSMQAEDLPDISSDTPRNHECQKVFDRISTFCGRENIRQRIDFLEQELAIFGYPAFTFRNKDKSNTSLDSYLDIVNLINICYDLLRQWRVMMESNGVASDLQRSSESEINRLKLMASRLKEEIAGKDRDLKSKDLLQHQSDQKLEVFKKKLKAEQEKSRRLTAEMTARDTQFKHEKKKKDQELDRLQTRLQQLLQDKRQERVLGFEILNSLQRTDGRRGKWNTDRTKKNNEQDMYRLIINNYEDAQKQLVKENEGMRKYLKEMQDELISALNERSSHPTEQSNAVVTGKKPDEDLERNGSRRSSVASDESGASEVSEPMSDGIFEMPYEMVKENLEKSMRTKWRALKKEIQRSRKTNHIQTAGRKVDDPAYVDIIHQQQELIDYLTSGELGPEGSKPIPEDCYFLEEKSELEKQKNTYLMQKQALEQERQLYAEAVVQLDEQRQAFEYEKSQWFQQNFLQLTPFRNDGRPLTSPHQNLRSKNYPQQSKSARQQPYYPRQSVSPEKSIRTSEHGHHHGSIQSPNSLNHSLSRLHSSGQSPYSPENSRRYEPHWSSVTPEQKSSVFPHKAKSTPANTSHQPSTAELYRTLGLVYYGSDKENEDSGNTVNGKLPHHHERRITSTSKAEHQRNIRLFHHRIKSASPTCEGLKPPKYEKSYQTDYSSISRSCDASYFNNNKTVMSGVTENSSKHRRSLSEPKDPIFELHSLKDTVDEGNAADSEDSMSDKHPSPLVVEDLKTALFRDSM